MAPSKQFVNVNSRQTRLYKNVSEDRLELLLDRFRARMDTKVDWIGCLAALFAAAACLYTLYDSWIGSLVQIAMLCLTMVFGTVVSYRMIIACYQNRNSKPMTNADFLSELVEEQEDEEDAMQTARVKDASVSI